MIDLPVMAGMKMRFFLEVLECSRTVRVIFMSRFPGQVLPPKLRENELTTLDYGLNLPVPIVDLSVDERGISATLSFSPESHPTLVLWGAVFTIMTDDVCASWRVAGDPVEPPRSLPSPGDGRHLRSV